MMFLEKKGPGTIDVYVMSPLGTPVAEIALTRLRLL